MFSADPILVDDIKFYRSRRGPQPPQVLSGEIRKAINFAFPNTDDLLFHAWDDLLTDAAHVSSGSRPDAVWVDGKTVDAVILCQDGIPANARRGLFGLTATEFALYHLKDTTTDIHNMYANTLAFMCMVSRRNTFTPTSPDAVRANTDKVLTAARHGVTVRGFLRTALPA